MTLPSADELLTGVSKHAHGSVDGLEDPERKVDWRAVGAGLRHYLPVVSALALAVALVGAGLMSDGCVEIVNVLHRHDITVSYLFRYYLHTLFAVLTLRFRTAARAACSPRGPRATVYGAGPLLLITPTTFVFL